MNDLECPLTNPRLPSELMHGSDICRFWALDVCFTVNNSTCVRMISEFYSPGTAVDVIFLGSSCPSSRELVAFTVASRNRPHTVKLTINESQSPFCMLPDDCGLLPTWHCKADLLKIGSCDGMFHSSAEISEAVLVSQRRDNAVVVCWVQELPVRKIVL